MEERKDGAIPWMSQACEAWRLWSDAHMRISQQWTNFSVNVAKEGMGLYAEVYATNLEALQAGQTYVMQDLHGIPEAMQQPRGVEHTWVQAFMELVASFANRSNCLKAQEKTDLCAIRTAGARGPKNTAITRIPTHALPQSGTHFSDLTACL